VTKNETEIREAGQQMETKEKRGPITGKEGLG
jgi:hypothetical protein